MSVAFERRGSGEPVVLIHGIGSRQGGWGPVAELLSAEREVISVDLPGFGASAGEPLPEPPSVPKLAEALADSFSEMGVSEPHVAGNSMGGGVAFELARMGAARSVTAFSPVGFGGDLSVHWERAVLGGAHGGAKLAERFGPEGGPTGWRLAIARPITFLMAFGRPFSAPADEVRASIDSLAGASGFPKTLEYVRRYRLADAEVLRNVPVTIAWGRRDVLLNWRIQSRRARRALPWARHVDLPRCGHVPFYDDPERCAQVLIEGTRG